MAMDKKYDHKMEKKLISRKREDVERLRNLKESFFEYKDKVSSLNSSVKYDSDEKRDIECLEGDILEVLLDYMKDTGLSELICESDNIKFKKDNKILEEFYAIDSNFDDKVEKSMFNNTINDEEVITQRLAVYSNQLAHRIETTVAENSESLGLYYSGTKSEENRASRVYKKALSIYYSDPSHMYSMDNVQKLLNSKNLDIKTCEDKDIKNIINIMTKCGIRRNMINKSTISTFNENLELSDIQNQLFNVKTSAYRNLIHSYIAKEKEGIDHTVDIVCKRDENARINGNCTIKFVTSGVSDLLPCGGHISELEFNNAETEFGGKIPIEKEIPSYATVNVPMAVDPKEIETDSDKRDAQHYKEFEKALGHNSVMGSICSCIKSFGKLRALSQNMSKEREVRGGLVH